MANYEVEVKMQPDAVIEAGLGIEEGGRIHKYFTEQCALHMDKYVPFDSGDLATTVVANSTVTGNVTVDTITYEQEYAKYQYYGMRKDGSHKINEANRKRDMHPIATTYWDQHMVTADMPDIIADVQKELERGGTND